MRCGYLTKTPNDSPVVSIHQSLGNEDYTEIVVSTLQEGLSKKEWNAWNVSEEFSKEAYTLCSELTEEAKCTRCVTAMIRKEDGTFWGDNPDCYGFEQMLRLGHINPGKMRCLVLGDGMRADTVEACLQKRGATQILRYREEEMKSSDEVYSAATDVNLIVNATDIGKYPDCEQSPVNLLRFQRVTAVADFVYKPFKSQLILHAERMQIATATGLSYLVYAAAKSEEFFSGHAVSEEEIGKVYQSLMTQRKSIILIGMDKEGCKKIGTVLSQNMKRELILFGQEGAGNNKHHFAHPSLDTMSESERQETEKLRELSVLDGKVMVFPGGMMANRENRLLLRRNSNVVWIQNPNCEEGSHKEYIFREPLYIESSDYTFVYNGNPENTAERIWNTVFQQQNFRL